MKGWCTQDGDHEPHPTADTPRHPATALLVPHCERMANAQVALHADAGEKKDAAMKIAKTNGNKKVYKI